MNGLDAAIYARWNVAGLNTAIAKLYPSGDAKGFNKTGSPEGSPLPRAEYFSVSPGTHLKTRGSRTQLIPVYIHVYGTSGSLVSGWMDQIRSKYVNGEKLLSVSSGKALEIDDGGSFVSKVDDAVWMGQQILMVNLQVRNVTPAI